jgi:hypothetical protein
MPSSSLLLVALACSEEEDSRPAAAETGDPAPAATFRVTDANNYDFASAIDAPSVRTLEFADLTIDWSALGSDMQCHDVDPVADIDNLGLMAFPYLSEEEVEAGLSAGTIEQADLGGYVSLEPGDRTSVSLSEFTFFTTDVDIETLYQDIDGSSWMLLLSTGTTVGTGARSIVFLDPEPDEPNTEVLAGDACGVIDLDVELETLQATVAPAEGPWIVDWSALSKDGQGLAIDFGKIDALMVARYSLTPAELEEQFFDLELIADELWTMDLPGGTSADLADLQGESGAFEGFTAEGTWLLALRCSLCPNPAPLFLTRVGPP